MLKGKVSRQRRKKKFSYIWYCPRDKQIWREPIKSTCAPLMSSFPHRRKPGGTALVQRSEIPFVEMKPFPPALGSGSAAGPRGARGSAGHGPGLCGSIAAWPGGEGAPGRASRRRDPGGAPRLPPRPAGAGRGRAPPSQSPNFLRRRRRRVGGSVFPGSGEGGVGRRGRGGVQRRPRVGRAAMTADEWAQGARPPHPRRGRPPGQV